MPDVILHHYPQSPVAEKVRVVLGMKDLDWHSVLIPRYPPKPDLIRLTGGYRRTPVMQIGANVYCDSQCIIRELERRYPQPTLFPGGSTGLAWGISRWTDGPLFNLIIASLFGEQGTELPDEFVSDRGRLYFGPGFDIRTFEAQLAQNLAQLRCQLVWVAQRLEDGREFLLGAQPGLPDALCYYLVWFFRGRVNAAPYILDQFPKLTAWEARVKAIGHGRPRELSAEQALAIARDAQPELDPFVDALDPLAIKSGDRVGVVPEGEGGDPTVIGSVVLLTQDTTALRRHDDDIGELAVHFPRVGYHIVVND